MPYRELIIFEKIFNEYILKVKKQKEVAIQYYILRNKVRECHCSFIGYATNGGKHGLHYNRQTNTYSFGHLNPETGSRPIFLLPGLEMKIPSKLKDGLLSVSNNKAGIIVKK